MLGRILVVEDDRFIREVLTLVLKAEGYAVDAAEDGAQAWRRLTELPPQLVVLDLALPNMDGLTICRKLRAREGAEHVPILVVSAVANEKAARSALEAGANAFLNKPFDLADLTAQVHSLLAASEAPPSRTQLASDSSG